MPRITDIFLVDTPVQHALAFHSLMSAPELPEYIGTKFMQLDEYVRANGAIPSDTPFVRISEADSQKLDIVVGMPVLLPMKGDLEIVYYQIPAGKKIFCYWQGDNADMPLVYDEMKRHAQLSGYRIMNSWYEYYLNGPGESIETLLTKIVIPIQ